MQTLTSGVLLDYHIHENPTNTLLQPSNNATVAKSPIEAILNQETCMYYYAPLSLFTSSAVHTRTASLQRTKWLSVVLCFHLHVCPVLVSRFAREQLQPLVRKMDDESQMDKSIIRSLFEQGVSNRFLFCGPGSRVVSTRWWTFSNPE